MRICMYLLFHPSSARHIFGKMQLKFSSFKRYLFIEILVRLCLLCIYWYLENAEAFHRPIPTEELWKYQYKTHNNTVETSVLLAICTLIPTAFIIFNYIFSNDHTDLIQGLLALSLSCLLNGVVITVLKICVGRPRPDYFYRCFPDGKVTFDFQCSGDPDTISEGRKSFPSGHTGWMFAGFGFLSLYLAGKLQCFTTGGRTQSWRVIVVVAPLLSAAVVGISRTQDNRHHWEDVTVGAILGLLSAFLCYYHYYPSLFSEECFLSYPLGCSSELSSSSSSLPLNTSRLTMSASRTQLTSNNSKSQLHVPEVKTL